MYPRKILLNIIKNLDNRKIIILIWPRQVWKTSIMKYLYNKIELNKVRFNLDNIWDCEKFQRLDILISYLKSIWLDFSKKIYLFVDEFQYCANSDRIFKNIYDTYENIKIISSWSSSMEIKNKIQESLAGRKKIFYIYSLDLEEFISWKLIKLWKTKELINFKVFNEINDISFLKEYFDYLYEYMIFGWYPEVVLNDDFESKKDALTSIFDLYLKRDILDFLNIKNVLWFKNLIKYLSYNMWNQINFSELSNFADIDINTLKSYIEILEHTYLIKKIYPFFTNKNKEIVKSPKIYFLDNWVRNFFINNFSIDIDLRLDKGFLFEAAVLQQFIKNWIKENIKYRRTKNQKEVDFVIDNMFELIGLEVKFKDIIKNKDLIGLKEFIKDYQDKIKKLYLVSKSNKSRIKIEDIDINVISIFDIFNEIIYQVV